MKRFRSTFLAVGSALVIAAAATAARPRYGGTLRIETEAIVRTLDPAAPPSDGVSPALRNRLQPLVFETLVTPNLSGGLRPALATSWESDARAMRWTIRLRPGVKLHDGSTLGPAQVAAALGAKNPSWKVTTTDDAIVIESDRQLPDLPWELADVRRAIGIRRAGGDLVGTGPFRPDRSEGGRLLLRAHEDYWGGRAFLDLVQIEMGRSPADQLTSLELGRADMVAVRASDLRRLSQRGLRVMASQPIELLALVFEGQRATSTSEATRRALALAINRPAICAVLLQRQGEPASALLPHWLSGYGSLFATSYSGASARALGTSLPADQRTLALRVEPTDPVSQSVAERIAVDGREAGITIKVEPAGTLAPRPDVRLIRVMLSPTSPERALARLLADLGPRITALLTPDPPPGPGAALEAVYQFERALVEHHIIVPIVHIPELYGIGAQVESWNGPIVLPSGAWDLASVWIRADKP